MRSQNIPENLMCEVAEKGGVTYSPMTSVPQHGYVVGKESLYVSHGLKRLDNETFRYALEQCKQKGGTYIGGWYDSSSGKIYWDLVEIIRNKHDALAVAMGRGEKAIYSLSEDKEITVEPAVV